ncbi:GIY-YIG nuclease family protein [Crocosphaera chwakensis]|uniref:GIY-YIG domain-containing protein n=1 Tax=Crocosphaera chwakensis CCY0110 TaxID=391612 RepID=A3ISR1_9CHRO|nr:GIY-YIG nuclease family protein [Crocosphaera chwakensis]EAZ90481.1 hypothetical protein CY0110_26677 [Crocosphaera chwakensis CCY0110]
MISVKNIYLLPKVSGVYKVIDGQGTIIYVGQSKNIYRRWNNGHHILPKIIRECGDNTLIDWVEVPEWLLNRVENMTVSFYQPKFNRKTPPVV